MLRIFIQKVSHIHAFVNKDVFNKYRNTKGFDELFRGKKITRLSKFVLTTFINNVAQKSFCVTSLILLF